MWGKYTIDWREYWQVRSDLIPYSIQEHMRERVVNPTFNKKPKNKGDIIVHPSKEEFRFGNCAAVAVTSAFDIPLSALKAIALLLKLNLVEGLSFFECKKVINLLGKANGMNVEYMPNYGEITFKQQLLSLNEGRYITMFSRHLCYSENGEIYDSLLTGDTLKEYLLTTPTGWWKIK